MSCNYIILLYTWIHGYSRLNPNLDSTVDSQSYILTTTEKHKEKKKNCWLFISILYIDLIIKYWIQKKALYPKFSNAWWLEIKALYLKNLRKLYYVRSTALKWYQQYNQYKEINPKHHELITTTMSDGSYSSQPITSIMLIMS